MNSRLRELANAFRSLANACTPVKQAWKVKYFKRVPFEGQPGMVKGVWTTEIVEAYNPEEAAKKIGPKLRPGYNCFVTRVRPGEEGYEEAEEGV